MSAAMHASPGRHPSGGRQLSRRNSGRARPMFLPASAGACSPLVVQGRDWTRDEGTVSYRGGLLDAAVRASSWRGATSTLSGWPGTRPSAPSTASFDVPILRRALTRMGAAGRSRGSPHLGAARVSRRPQGDRTEVGLGRPITWRAEGWQAVWIWRRASGGPAASVSSRYKSTTPSTFGPDGLGYNRMAVERISWAAAAVSGGATSYTTCPSADEHPRCRMEV